MIVDFEFETKFTDLNRVFFISFSKRTNISGSIQILKIKVISHQLRPHDVEPVNGEITVVPALSNHTSVLIYRYIFIGKHCEF